MILVVDNVWHVQLYWQSVEELSVVQTYSSLSTALLKCDEMTMTHGWQMSILVMLLRRDMIAAVLLEQVWRTANVRSVNEMAGRGWRLRQDERSDKLLCTPWLMILVRTGVMEMWRKSVYACCFGGKNSGIGWMLACFHCCRTVEVSRDQGWRVELRVCRRLHLWGS